MITAFAICMYHDVMNALHVEFSYDEMLSENDLDFLLLADFVVLPITFHVHLVITRGNLW
jgi:hypothetical protein